MATQHRHKQIDHVESESKPADTNAGEVRLTECANQKAHERGNNQKYVHGVSPLVAKVWRLRFMKNERMMLGYENSHYCFTFNRFLPCAKHNQKACYETSVGMLRCSQGYISGRGFYGL